MNNFSEVSAEMIQELVEAMKGGDMEEAEDLIQLISNNLKVINEHGSRADSIVKSMLQHSRGGSGEMEPTNINALIKEFVNLSYHGRRANDKSMNVEIDLELQKDIGEVMLKAEDFSRVILNLCNNAFDAMKEKQDSGHKVQGAWGYESKLTVRTKLDSDIVTIEIEDNGPGIPCRDEGQNPAAVFYDEERDAGTGLGLSITNDIIKAHGGSLDIESSEAL